MSALPTPFVELAAASNFSFLRGASHPEELVITAAALGSPGIAVCDRNTLAGVVRTYLAGKEVGLRTAVGCRLVFRDGTPDILAWPTDRAAYGRLCRLLTVGNMRGEKDDCRLDLADLLEWRGGLVLAIVAETGAAAAIEAAAAALAPAATEPLRLAINRPYGPDDQRAILGWAALARRLALRPLATNLPLYHAPERRPLQDVITAVREHTTVEAAGRLLQANAERHLKSPAEMARLFDAVPAALAETTLVLDRLAFRLDELRYEYPEEPTDPGRTPQETLVRLTWDGAEKRYPAGIPERTRKQLRHELTLIEGLDYAPYFLTVYDVVRFARERGILAQGRGSAANSAVCFCLGVTEVDPDRADLLFERFISPERREPPDIDVDFEHERREEVIQYVYEKYGRDRAGIAATVITYRARSAAREVGKALGFTEDAVSSLAGAIWGGSGEGVAERDAARAGLEPSDHRIAHLVRLSKEIAGFPRHLSQHVGGFVITRGRLDELVPVVKAAMDDRTNIEWDKDDLDSLGILKIDVLALGMLTCVRKALALLSEHYSDHFEPAAEPSEMLAPFSGQAARYVPPDARPPVGADLAAEAPPAGEALPAGSILPADPAWDGLPAGEAAAAAMSRTRLTPPASGTHPAGSALGSDAAEAAHDSERGSPVEGDVANDNDQAAAAAQPNRDDGLPAQPGGARTGYDRLGRPPAPPEDADERASPDACDGVDHALGGSGIRGEAAGRTAHNGCDRIDRFDEIAGLEDTPGRTSREACDRVDPTVDARGILGEAAGHHSRNGCDLGDNVIGETGSLQDVPRRPSRSASDRLIAEPGEAERNSHDGCDRAGHLIDEPGGREETLDRGIDGGGTDGPALRNAHAHVGPDDLGDASRRTSSGAESDAVPGNGRNGVPQYRNWPVTVATIPPEDPEVYDMICRADTLGVFQIESRAQMTMLPRLKPRTFYDLVIEVAIVRPGPIQGDMVHPYLRRRQKKEPVSYPSKELEEVLAKTLGVPLFQEQAMRIAMVAAGFTPSEADQLRRAMATFRKVGTIGSFQQKMIDGMTKRGYDPDFAERCFRQIEGFGEYGFPESHAASFALLVYSSCWLKCHYPDVFCTALLNSQPMGFYAPAQIVRDARLHGVEVRPVDVNLSDWDCTLEPGPPAAGRLAPEHSSMREAVRSRCAVRLGLRQVKGLSEDDMRLLVARRGAGYDSLRDLWLRTGYSRATVERLADADAFGSIGHARRDALWAARGLDRVGRAEDLPLFAAAATAELQREAAADLPPMPLGEEVINDYRFLSLSLKAHPAGFVRAALAAERVVPANTLSRRANGRRLSVAGLVLVRQRPGSAKGVIFMTVEDETGIANVIVWPKVFEAYRQTVLGARFIKVSGRVQAEDGVIHVVADQLEDRTGLLAALTEDAGDWNALDRADEVKRPQADLSTDIAPRSRLARLVADTPDLRGEAALMLMANRAVVDALAANRTVAEAIRSGRRPPPDDPPPAPAAPAATWGTARSAATDMSNLGATIRKTRNPLPKGRNFQ